MGADGLVSGQACKATPSGSIPAASTQPALSLPATASAHRQSRNPVPPTTGNRTEVRDVASRPVRGQLNPPRRGVSQIFWRQRIPRVSSGAGARLLPVCALCNPQRSRPIATRHWIRNVAENRPRATLFRMFTDKIINSDCGEPLRKLVIRHVTAALTALGSRFRGNDEMGAGIDHLRARYPAMRAQAEPAVPKRKLPLIPRPPHVQDPAPSRTHRRRGHAIPAGSCVEQFRRRDLPTGPTRPGFAGALRAMFFFIVHHNLARFAM